MVAALGLLGCSRIRAVHLLYNPNSLPYGGQGVAVKKVVRKRRPRGTGKYPLIAIRLSPQLISQLDRYAKERKISRSEAVREFVSRGLADLKL